MPKDEHWIDNLAKKINIMELPLDAIKWDTSRDHFRDMHFVREHLRYILERSEKWPVVLVSLASESFVATGGLPYLEIAREIGRRTVHATLIPGQDTVKLQAALLRHGGKFLRTRNEIEELAQPSYIGEHIFFFNKSLTKEQQAEFHKAFQSAVDSEEARITFDLGGEVACALVRQSAEDLPFANRLLASMLVFHREVCVIASYQGCYFPP